MWPRSQMSFSAIPGGECAPGHARQKADRLGVRLSVCPGELAVAVFRARPHDFSHIPYSFFPLCSLGLFRDSAARGF